MINWAEKNTQILLTAMIFLICYSVLAGFSLAPQSALDTYWHLKMGDDLLEKGLSPWTDHYSFTYNGEDIRSTPVLFQVALAYFVSVFGEIKGFAAFKLTYVTLLLFAIYKFFKQIKAPWFVILLVLPILCYFIHMRLIIRPDTISNILIVICLSLYLKARENFGTKELISICVLLLIWAIYHTPIFGYIIIFSLFLDKAIARILSGNEDFTWSHWFFWGGLIFLIGFINPGFGPGFNHVLLLALSLTGDWSKYLSEYFPSHIVYSSNKLVHLLWATSLILIIWATIKRHYGLAFLVAIFGYYSWAIIRIIPPAALINFSILAYFLSQPDSKEFFSKIKPSFRVSFIITALFVISFTSYQVLDNTITRLKSFTNYQMHAKNVRKIIDVRFPSQISDYLNNFQNGGNVFNNFNLGGYLTYALSSDYKIFIDGRTNILYPIEFYEHYLETISDINVLEDDIRKYDIQYAVVTNTPRAHHYFSNTDMLTINFADENFILFSKENKIAFPVASKLTLYPMCWNDRLSKQAQEEIFLSERFFSGKQYVIREILEVLKKYLSQENNATSIDNIRPETLSSDSSKRLAAYLTLKTGKYEAANSFYRSIEKKKDNDLLMLSYSSAMLEDYSSAEALLNNYLVQKGDLKKSPFSNFNRIIILKTLTEIQPQSTLQYNSPSNINALKEEPGINKSLYSQSLRPGIPYDNTCEPIFKSYEDQK